MIFINLLITISIQMIEERNGVNTVYVNTIYAAISWTTFHCSSIYMSLRTCMTYHRCLFRNKYH